MADQGAQPPPVPVRNAAGAAAPVVPGVVPAPHTGGGGAGTTGANPDAARRWAQRLRAAGGLDVANLRRVLTYLDPVSLCAASCVNVLWNGAGTSDDLWRILAHAHGFSHAYSERQGYRRFACFSYKNYFTLKYDMCERWSNGVLRSKLLKAPEAAAGAQAGPLQGVQNLALVHGTAAMRIAPRQGLGSTMLLSMSTPRVPSSLMTVFDVRTGRQVASHSVSPNPCAMCVAGEYMVAAHTKGRTLGLLVYMLGVPDRPIHELVGHTSTITCVRAATFPYRPPVAVSGGYDRTVCVWDLKTGALLQRLSGHARNVWSVQVCVPDVDEALFRETVDGAGGTLTTPAFDFEAIKAAAVAEEEAAAAAEAAAAEAAGGDGDDAGAAAGAGVGVAAAAGVGAAAGAGAGAGAGGAGGAGAAAAGAGARGGDGRYMHDAAGRARAEPLADPARDEMERSVRGILTRTARRLLSRMVVFSSGNNWVTMWDPLRGTALQRFEGHTDTIMDIQFDSVSGRLITAGYDSTVIIFDATTGAALHRVPHPTTVFMVDVDWKAGVAVSGCRDGYAFMLDIVSGTVLRKFGPVPSLGDVKAVCLQRRSVFLGGLFGPHVHQFFIDSDPGGAAAASAASEEGACTIQ